MHAKRFSRAKSHPPEGGGGKHLRLREIGPDAGRQFLLGAGDNVVGSDGECVCRLQDRGISRRHAVVCVKPDRCLVRDLGSKNGTLVDVESIQERELKLGDDVAFGATLWVLEAVPDDDVELAVEVELHTDHGGLSSIEGDTLSLAGEPTGLPVGVELPAGIVAGTAPAMTTLYQRLAAIRRSDVAILITGETGVGKEHVAQAVHLGSARRGGPFVALNCAAVPSDLLEAELFGVGKGVATGVSARRGKIREAAGGTLFLDEVGELLGPLQAKLLRVLQEKEVVPLGESAEPVDVRFVAATNVDLGSRIADRRFRSDLYYRLAGYELAVPPLRDRVQDLPVLAGFFIRQVNREAGKRARGLTVGALRALQDRPWEGNIREFQNEIRRLVLECPDGQAIDSNMLTKGRVEPRGAIELLADRLELGKQPLAVLLESIERRLVARALQETDGNRSAAARLLGVSRNGLTLRLERLGLGD